MGLSQKEEEELLMLLEQQEIDKLFQPQPGPQEMFLNCTADVAIYGGAAGGGKTYALLLECCRHRDVSGFGAVIFRRNANQIMTEGGLWDNATALYQHLQVEAKLTPRPVLTFSSGARVSFAHLQYDADVQAWMGAQIPLICYDELTHFTRKQFMYMLSRNRSTCGVKPYIRATCNPDPDSFVAELIAWWLDKDGNPILARSGVIRYFTVVDDVFIWGDSRAEVASKCAVRESEVKSFTFIASSVYDNRILLEKDPGYLGNLNALSAVDKARLLGGNWKIRPAAGNYFKREQATVVYSIPGRVEKWCRAWDLAATEPTPTNPSPDATAGVLMGKLADGRYIVADVKKKCLAPAGVRNLVKGTGREDRDKYRRVPIRLPQDPGQAGKEQAQSYVSFLAGFTVKTQRVSGDKITRAEPFSSQWQSGNVLVLAGDWNDAYFSELEAFPDGAHDDQVDASSDAFAELQGGRGWGGVTS